MRASLLLLLALSLASAGCFGGGDAPPAGTSPAVSTPSSTPPASSPVATTPATTPAPTREAKLVYNGSHDFAGPPPAPNAPAPRENFTVDAGYATLEVRIVFTSTAGPAGDLSLSAGAAVRVLDPAGVLLVECTGKDDPDCAKDLPAPAAGAWSVEYAGSGTSKATVAITEIP